MGGGLDSGFRRNDGYLKVSIHEDKRGEPPSPYQVWGRLWLSVIEREGIGEGMTRHGSVKIPRLYFATLGMKCGGG